MPIIYLSPSTQEYNEYVNGLGNEEEWMNRLADAMEPMLFASGIQYTRNTPDMTAASSIRASNAGNCTWPCTPTPPAKTRRAKTGGSSPSISREVPGECGLPSS